MDLSGYMDILITLYLMLKIKNKIVAEKLKIYRILYKCMILMFLKIYILSLLCFLI